jgi:hypothetical protein
MNGLGMTFNYTGLKGSQMETAYTDFLVKEILWRPIQKTMFGFESTTQLETSQINAILDVLSNFFADRGVSISFPSQIDLLIRQYEENGIN